MDTVRYKGEKIHVGCGGAVVRGTCLKCGERDKSFLKKILGEGPLIIKNKDVEETVRKAHRERIREGKDIFKEL